MNCGEADEKGRYNREGGRDAERVCKWEGRARLRMRAQFQSDSHFARSVWRHRETIEETSQTGLRRLHSVCFRLCVSLWTFKAPARITKAAAPHATGWDTKLPPFRSLLYPRKSEDGRWERDALTLVEFKRKKKHHSVESRFVLFVLESSRKPLKLWLKESGRGGEKASRSALRGRRCRGLDAPPPEGASRSLGRGSAPDRVLPRGQGWPHSKHW